MENETGGNKMSEAIGCSIEIGGDLPEELYKELVNVVNDDIYELNQYPPENIKALGKKTLTWSGTADYGLISGVMAFCEEHNLSYIHKCDAKYEYDATVTWWTPGMKEPCEIKSDNDQDALVGIDTIRPLCDLLLAMSKDGDKALPLFVGNKALEHIVEKGLKNPKQLPNLLKKEIDKLLPTRPTLPVFRIIPKEEAHAEETNVPAITKTRKKKARR
jgi:hypothetical protein